MPGCSARVCGLAAACGTGAAGLQRKAAWLGCVAPFALMALSGAILYHGFSQDLVANDGVLGDKGLRLSHFANELANRVGGMPWHVRYTWVQAAICRCSPAPSWP